MYAISVTLLILTLYDGKVQWYEALIFVLTYAFYIIGIKKLTPTGLLLI